MTTSTEIKVDQGDDLNCLERKRPNDSLESGVAPIKTEFLLKLDRKVSPRITPNETNSKGPDDDYDDDAAEGRKGNNEERHRGQHQNRNKINRKGPSQNGLCPAIARGETCPIGDSCRYNHDIGEFMKTRPNDIGNECPNFMIGASCKFGLLCRFSSGHSKDIIETVNKPTVEEDKLNELLGKVRRKQVEFPSTSEFLTKLKVADKECLTFKESYPFGEKSQVDFRGKLYLAPLTTVGNLPFRRICKEYGVDITCGEMAMCTNILKGQASEFALLRRHESEDIFGVQLCGGWTDSMAQCAELLNSSVDCDFIDVNMGCPIDIVYKKGMGSGLMDKTNRVKEILTGMRFVLKDKPLTVKMRIGIDDGKPLVPKLLPILASTGVNAVTIHGRTRKQRYTKEADWNYISKVVDLAKGYHLPVIGNGDILSFDDFARQKSQSNVDSIMIARGALIKPWIFTEIKEERTWDISSSERFDMLRRYVHHGLEHFGSDTAGVEKTRRFLLEWLSFLCRYIPVGILERLPQRMNDRPPAYYGRNQLETLMASPSVLDWVKISEMLLGPVTEGFVFLPKHKSSSYDKTSIIAQG